MRGEKTKKRGGKEEEKTEERKNNRDKKEEVAKSEEEAKKLVPECFHKWIHVFGWRRRRSWSISNNSGTRC